MATKIKYILLAVIMAGLMIGSYVAMKIEADPADNANRYDPHTIVVDGGGDIGNFNSTASMEKSTSNPSPYNTLETLCKEWMALKGHEEYTVIVSKTSYNGSQGSLRPLLNAATAPDIIFMNGTVAEENKDKGWTVNLDAYKRKTDGKMVNYMETPNPYDVVYEKDGITVKKDEDGKDVLRKPTWYDIWERSEFPGVSNGGHYFVNMERIPIGIVYNESLLKAAGYDPGVNGANLQTFDQLMNAMQKCFAKYGRGGNTQIFLSPYRWYDIQIESNLFGWMLQDPTIHADRDDNGVVTLDELKTIYAEGHWGINTDLFRLYLDIIQYRHKYFANNYDTQTALNSFAQGKCVFMDCHGTNLRQLYFNKTIRFTYTIIGYPSVTKDGLSRLGFDVSSMPDTDIGSRAGSAGYGTSWWITNTAMNKGDATVDACVDLLKYLTAPKQNDRMIADLGGGVPLNIANLDIIKDYLKPLTKKYQDDCGDPNKLGWGVFNSWNVLGNEFSSYFLNQTNTYIKDCIKNNNGEKKAAEFNTLVYNLNSTADSKLRA